MTLAEFTKVLGELEDHGIAVTKYRGLENTFPRITWQEGRIEQNYSSDLACEEDTIAVAEFMTFDSNDPKLQLIKNTFRKHKLPFACEVGFDEKRDIISYLFNVRLKDDIPYVE